MTDEMKETPSPFFMRTLRCKGEDESNMPFYVDYRIRHDGVVRRSEMLCWTPSKVKNIDKALSCLDGTRMSVDEFDNEFRSIVGRFTGVQVLVLETPSV
jgi:hypothetical protein